MRRLLMTFEYVSTSLSETVAAVLVGVNGLALLGFYLLLCFDFYLECEHGGTVDSACYFGTFRVFGNYQRNSEAFFLVWVAIVVYTLIVSFGWRSLVDFVRVPARHVDANRVRVWRQDETQLIYSGKLSPMLAYKRAAELTMRRFASKVAMKVWGASTAVELSRSGRYATVPVHATPTGRRYFVFECRRYAVPGEQPVLCTLPSPTVQAIRDYVVNPMDATSRADVFDRIGSNAIAITTPTYGLLLAEEFLSPFYSYQLVIYLMWIYWTYWFVGIVLLLIVVLSGSWSVYVKRRNLLAVHALASHRDGCEFLVDGRWEPSRDSRALVPGDVVKVRGGGWTVPADLVLVQGSCACDESGLTGETMPSSKTSLSSASVDAALVVDIAAGRWKGHALFAGTVCLDASSDSVAVVLATGIDASRGQLLREVLFPVKTLLQFDEEFALAVSVLLVYAVIVFCASLYLQSRNQSLSSWTTIVLYGVFSVSQIVSPLLKIALVAGQIASAKRLADRGITCVDTQRIDVAGKVTEFCFDKTGTLTQDGLSLIAVKRFAAGGLQDVPLAGEVLVYPAPEDDVVRAMASCHSVGEFNGMLLGSAVETSMFKASAWSLASADVVAFSGPLGSLGSLSGGGPISVGEHKLTVTRRLPFDPARRTMGVVVTPGASLANTPVLFIKGAPEAVIPLCSGGSAVPSAVSVHVNRLASEGCYVLALARKPLAGWTLEALSSSPREDFERGLEFLGLIVFRNELKSDALRSIQELKRGAVSVRMVTGDSAHTAAFVARECGVCDDGCEIFFGQLASGQKRLQWTRMVGNPHDVEADTVQQILKHFPGAQLVVTGEAFDALCESGDMHNGALLRMVRVFARTSPQQKVRVVKAFIEDGAVVAMAGDGSNDSGALRAASVGVSLGAAEASVVATFTSKSRSVSSCVELLREGRASLSTSFASYKLLVVYGLLFSVVKLTSFYFAVLMPLLGYILIDLLAVVPLTFAMTLGEPLDVLANKLPTSSLLGPRTVSSVLAVYIVTVCSLSVNLSVMSNAAGYVRWPAQFVDTAAWWFISDNWEASTIWVTVFLLFITSGLTFSFGTEFRKSILTNWVLILCWVALYLTTTLVFLTGPNTVTVAFHMASEQFNCVDPVNPVWAQYRAAGGAPSPSMALNDRLFVWGMSQIALLCLVVGERAIIQGQAGRWIASKVMPVGWIEQ